MINEDEDSLICDFAETYHIYDYRKLPMSYVAILANGLREDSRIKMKLSEMDISTNNMLMASILDELRFLSWTKTEDAEKNQNRPKSVLKILMGQEEHSGNETYESAEDFERARNRILGDIANG